ncbi:RNA-binding protein Musashi [Geosmithia morbida]|uniref:RNA-binding protein Musashi n=1 Tax=Geosmithia morbida TaxID=1094350 RepID=A0A9P4YSR7_9HYPO|nr:RNA-binding protein Musashi [Geosmithia morbida]KAF4121048.1 RNA-binding protein Musashi [Geosmithia morbida]
MADPENFEEDLFADLYDDNDASKGPAPAPAPATAPPAPAPAPVQETRTEDAAGHDHAHDAGAAEDMNQDQDDDDDDDDVDFNLGGGNAHTGPSAAVAQEQHVQAPTPPQYGSVHKASAKDDGKMFIGGLNWETTDQSLRDYFSQFGEVVECTVMRDSATGRSRGFGFLTFKDAKTVNIVMVKEHYLDGKIIDPKRAIPRDEQEKTSKIFVGGVSQETTDQEFRDYFAQFGRVVDATLMMDKDTGRPRGFGFVTFESESGVDACIDVPLEIHGKPVEVKKAQPRGNLRDDDDSSKRMKFQQRGGPGGGGGDQGGAQGGMGGNGMGNNGMTPQVMAQYFQRMQQYFAMMQSQMAMRGMPQQMNPQMMQQMMQMQQMQQQMMGGAGGPGGPGGPGGQQNMMGGGPGVGMNPQQMQQMQQQMMQQQQQQQQQQGGGGYDQYSQQQHHGGGPGGRRGGGRGGSFGGYGGGSGGSQASYEGMYDDAPPRDGTNAPPANAPTGPKNAGKPGANYRGGGRGGNRGFHPYAR